MLNFLKYSTLILSSLSYFLELLYSIAVEQDFSDIYRRQQNVIQLSNGSVSDFFPRNFVNILCEKLEKLNKDSQDFLALAMFFEYWTSDDIYIKFKDTFFKAEKWNCYFMACSLQELKRISSQPVSIENHHRTATFFSSWSSLGTELHQQEKGYKSYEWINQEKLDLPEKRTDCNTEELLKSYL